MARRAGAQILIAQGVEAGGHVRGTTPLELLLPEVVSSSSVPVLAAGGMVDGRDLASALRLGAQGVVIGTAFLALPEFFAHDYHKQRILGAKAEETILTDIFHINWPMGASVRVLRNSTTRGERGDPFELGPNHWRGGRAADLPFQYGLALALDDRGLRADGTLCRSRRGPHQRYRSGRRTGCSNCQRGRPPAGRIHVCTKSWITRAGPHIRPRPCQDDGSFSSTPSGARSRDSECRLWVSS